MHEPPSISRQAHWSARLGLLLLSACGGDSAPSPGATDGERPVPVELGAVERGPLTDRRTVSGSLEPAAEFVVAAKVSGRLVRLDVNLGDLVHRGQVVAQLDDDEFAQAVQEVEASLAVAQASHAEAQSNLELAQRALKRLESLRTDGVASEAQLDAALAEVVASRAREAVTEASVARSEASLRSARIRLGYTRVTCEWNGEDETRVVGERFVDEGGNVAANTPLLSVVQLDPVLGVVHVAERDYRLLAVGQRTVLTTDAYPGETFAGRIARIAPVFRSATRQARVELELANPGAALKPGMFVRATLELAHVEDAVTVPHEAITERGGVSGVLALDSDGEHVSWRPITLGIREGPRVQIMDDALDGKVVTLGHELCEDGARVKVVGADAASSAQ